MRLVSSKKKERSGGPNNSKTNKRLTFEPINSGPALFHPNIFFLLERTGNLHRISFILETTNGAKIEAEENPTPPP